MLSMLSIFFIIQLSGNRSLFPVISEQKCYLWNLVIHNLSTTYDCLFKTSLNIVRQNDLWVFIDLDYSTSFDFFLLPRLLYREFNILHNSNINYYVYHLSKELSVTSDTDAFAYFCCMKIMVWHMCTSICSI